MNQWVSITVFMHRLCASSLYRNVYAFGMNLLHAPGISAHPYANPCRHDLFIKNFPLFVLLEVLFFKRQSPLHVIPLMSWIALRVFVPIPLHTF